MGANLGLTEADVVPAQVRPDALRVSHAGVKVLFCLDGAGHASNVGLRAASMSGRAWYAGQKKLG